MDRLYQPEKPAQSLQLPFARSHFWVVLTGFVLFALGSTPGYRISAQLNVVLVCVSLWRLRKANLDCLQRHIVPIVAVAAFFIVLNFFAVGDLALERSLPRVVYATFWALALVLLPLTLPLPFLRQTGTYLLWAVSAYLLGQFAVIVLVENFPACAPCSGTTSNPHYLALFTLLAIPVVMLRLLVTRGAMRMAAIALMGIALFLLVETLSRPSWISVMIAFLLAVMFLEARAKVAGFLMVIGLPVALYALGPTNFTSRIDDLVANISKEERVAIWSDGWTMQMQTTEPGQWLWGHGLDSYFEAFKAYSSYHGVRDFAFPHNFILELLYLSGALGLLAGVLIYFLLARQFLAACRAGASAQTRPVRVAVLCTFVAVGMHSFLVIPFFSHYHLAVLALAAGVFAYQRRTNGGDDLEPA